MKNIEGHSPGSLDPHTSKMVADEYASVDIHTPKATLSERSHDSILSRRLPFLSRS